MVYDIKKIAKHYARGSMLYDLTACIPFHFLSDSKKIRLFRLLKLLRVPRLFGLMNVEHVK